MRCRMGNPKKKSRFICLHCLMENQIGAGIQRSNQREKGHIKDLYCLECKTITKNLEIRYCDSFNEMKQKSEELHREYYNEDYKEVI